MHFIKMNSFRRVLVLTLSSVPVFRLQAVTSEWHTQLRNSNVSSFFSFFCFLPPLLQDFQPGLQRIVLPFLPESSPLIQSSKPQRQQLLLQTTRRRQLISLHPLRHRLWRVGTEHMSQFPQLKPFVSLRLRSIVELPDLRQAWVFADSSLRFGTKL